MGEEQESKVWKQTEEKLKQFVIQKWRKFKHEFRSYHRTNKRAKYLSVILKTENNTSFEINNTISKSKNVLGMFYSLMKNKHVLNKVKTLVSANILRPILTYKHKTCYITNKIKGSI